MRLFMLLFVVSNLIFFSSCHSDIDDEILPIIGVYEANVIGETGPFSLSISSKSNDNIFVDAPFDGDVWSIIEADVDYNNDGKWNINIYRQEVENGVEIWGEGFYYEGSIHLEYNMSFWGDKYEYVMVGTK